METAQRNPVHFNPDYTATKRLKDLIFRMTLAEGLAKKVDFVSKPVERMTPNYNHKKDYS